MAKSLDELITEIQKNQKAYTPLTQQQMQQQAANRYNTVYDQKRLSAQQAYQTSDQTLAQQLAGLQATYDKQREQSRENTQQTYAAADRQALGRGMQRSSYNNATLANINLKGNKALQDISDAQAAQEKNIGDQRALMSKQLSTQLAQYDAAQQADMLAYLDELEAREYDRSTAAAATANQLALQMYQYQFQKDQADREQANWQAQYDFNKQAADREQANWQAQYDFNKQAADLEQANWLKQFAYQQEQDALAQSNWQAQFNAQYGGRSSGGGSGNRRSSSSSSTPPAAGGSIWDELNKENQSPSTRKTVSGVRKNQTNTLY